jgi:hypothetical protein
MFLGYRHEGAHPQKIGEQDVAHEYRIEKQAEQVFHMLCFQAGNGHFWLTAFTVGQWAAS